MKQRANYMQYLIHSTKGRRQKKIVQATKSRGLVNVKLIQWPVELYDDFIPSRVIMYLALKL